MIKKGYPKLKASRQAIGDAAVAKDTMVKEAIT
jgi:hypothetical protein